MKKILPLSLVAALLLTGCASSDPKVAEESATPSTATSEAATSVEPSQEQPAAETTASSEATAYAFATGMTFGKVSTDGEPGKEFEAFLDGVEESVGEEVGDQFTYWTVKIDNREGTDDAKPNQLRMYDAAGTEYLFVDALNIVEAVFEQIPEAPEDATGDSPEWREREKLFKLYEKAFDAENQLAHPGAVKEFVVVTGDKLPDEISKMAIDLGGLIGEADVITMEDAESQGYPLDF